MRIKIKGPITPERLVSCLEDLKNRYGNHFGGFYGANLYLNVYNKDGEPCDIVDHRGEPLILSFGVPDGEVARPPITEEAKERRKKMREAEAASQAKFEEEWRLRREQHAREVAEREAKYQEAKAHIDRWNELTSILIKHDQEEFLARTNAAIHSFWEETQPVYTAGKSTGEVRPIPKLQIEGGKLQFLSGKTVKKIKNPICCMAYGKVASHWNYPEWEQVTARLTDVMTMMAKELDAN